MVDLPYQTLSLLEGNPTDYSQLGSNKFINKLITTNHSYKLGGGNIYSQLDVSTKSQLGDPTLHVYKRILLINWCNLSIYIYLHVCTYMYIYVCNYIYILYMYIKYII